MGDATVENASNRAQCRKMIHCGKPPGGTNQKHCFRYGIQDSGFLKKEKERKKRGENISTGDKIFFVNVGLYLVSIALLKINLNETIFKIS